MPLRSKIAIIDLSNNKITIEPIPERLRRLYLGGRGIGAHLIYNHVEPGTDPLGPGNALVISAGIPHRDDGTRSSEDPYRRKVPTYERFWKFKHGWFFWCRA